MGLDDHDGLEREEEEEQRKKRRIDVELDDASVEQEDDTSEEGEDIDRESSCLVS